ncbi:MAG: hypothetical protein V4513_01075 [Pseudomonadota bacterium]
MSSGIDPRDADIEKASEKLTDGLRACRSMLNDYRVALMGESGAEPADGLLREWRTQEDSNL